jgi:hypothetical protein
MKIPRTPSVINHRKLKVDDMYPEIAGDQNYDDHYTNYSEDVHSDVLQLTDNSVRRASTPHVHT